jgi:hypothetical protein
MPKHIEIEFRRNGGAVEVDGIEASENAVAGHTAGAQGLGSIRVPWEPATMPARKGVAWKPSDRPELDSATQQKVLTAIARARSWIDDLIEGRVEAFHDIARREGKVERHIRFLIPLAFLSPRVVEAIAAGTVPTNLSVTDLARALPHNWNAQEKRFERP